MNTYIVNTSSIHNYQWIKAAVPSVLYDEIYAPLISDHTVLRVHAAQVLRSKKNKDQSGGTNGDEPSSTELGVFKKSQKTRRKGKGKAVPTNTQPVQPHAISSDPKPSSPVSSGNIQTPTPFIYTHPSSNQRHEPRVSVPYDFRPPLPLHQTYPMHPVYTPAYGLLPQASHVGTSFGQPRQPHAPHDPCPPLPPHQAIQSYPMHSAYTLPYRLLPQAPHVGTSFGQPHQPHAAHDPRPPLPLPYQTIQTHLIPHPAYSLPYGSLPQAPLYPGTSFGQPHITGMFPYPNASSFYSSRHQ